MKSPPEEPIATAKFIFIRFTAIRESITFTGGSVVKNPSANEGDVGLIPGWGRFPGEALQYSCLGDLMDRGAWWATVHGVSKESDTT